MIFIYSDGPVNKVLRNTIICIWLCLMTSAFNIERNHVISINMPTWYLECGDYIYLIMAVIWISKSIWKIKPKHVVYNLILANALWLLPFATSFIGIDSAYVIISMMFITPLILILIFHRKKVLIEYQT